MANDLFQDTVKFALAHKPDSLELVKQLEDYEVKLSLSKLEVGGDESEDEDDCEIDEDV